MKILGIESSCDETAIAIICHKTVLLDEVFSQKDHDNFGGVVPELSARAHLRILPKLLAKIDLSTIDAIAVGAGPGLIGGVLVGVNFAKGLALGLNKPLYPINHLAAHALSVRIEHDVSFPYLLLLISGGHCQFLEVQNAMQYKLLGQTLDDSPGEVFDKIAKTLNLGYPGGPQIEILAKTGDPERFHFPRPLYGRKDCNLSFSGLKTAVNMQISKTPDAAADIAASFQHAICLSLGERLSKALELSNAKRVVIAGGVAANIALRAHLAAVCLQHKRQLFYPRINLCTDNAVMISWAALEMMDCLKPDLLFAARPRWFLDSRPLAKL